MRLSSRPAACPGGRHDFYPLFRGEGGDGFFFTLFNLNRVEFGGQGVSAP